MRIRNVGLDSLEALAKHRLLEGALIYNLKLGECCVLNKKMKVKFGTATHRSEVDCVRVDVWGPTKTASLGSHRYFISFVDDCSTPYPGYIPRYESQNIFDHIAQFSSCMCF